MKKGIRHFMWGYQPHYRVHLQIQAESVLGQLDSALNPEVFLVGILPEPKAGKYSACVEPEDECWIESEAFDGVIELASTLRPGYPESQLFQSHQLAQARSDDALFRRSIGDAISQVIEGHPSKPAGLSFFVSIPEWVHGYLVSAVLAVATHALESHFRLSSSWVALHQYRRFYVSRSLIDAAINELLAEAADGLLRPDPGLRTSDKRADEILRSAGRRLVVDAAARVDVQDLGLGGLFDAICEIATLRYEQAEGRGKLILALKDHDSIRKRIVFADTIGIKEHRRVRKLLELASGESALHITCQNVLALVDADVPVDISEEVFTFRILGHHHWELIHGPNVLMGVRFGQPYLPRLTGYEPKLRQDLPRLFPDISDEAVDRLISLVRQAERERHGTLLLISKEAESEADRLRGQATPIVPQSLTPELLRDLTGIDGAVLLDPSGRCFGIGVILDGLAANQGDPSRGARFNSAVRYVQSASDRDIATLAVVVSEDGGVDFIPNLRPRVRRSVLTGLIDELDTIASGEHVPLSRYNRCYDTLRKMRFYLLPGDCDRLNNAVRKIEQHLRDEDPWGIQILRDEFSPNEAMNPAFYYEPE